MVFSLIYILFIILGIYFYTSIVSKPHSTPIIHIHYIHFIFVELITLKVNAVITFTKKTKKNTYVLVL